MRTLEKISYQEEKVKLLETMGEGREVELQAAREKPLSLYHRVLN